MSDFTSKDEFDFNDDIFFEEEKVDSPKSVENEENAVTTMSLLQEEVSSNCFNQIENDKIIARLCGKCEQKFSPTTTTGVLSNHLNNKHSIELTLKRNSLIQRPYSRGDA
ncbi:20985_t:CDS:2 [Dentiscutata erythropus]|uniref:20985_t:CDS:1 n=1 Tax=Dentiscutata erythropus TaxID=1348616 RepID=A0A9N9JVQ4_9GLOM|nr:20985_t:CDS:2 [Dentiscutata erythropus]